MLKNILPEDFSDYNSFSYLADDYMPKCVHFCCPLFVYIPDVPLEIWRGRSLSHVQLRCRLVILLVIKKKFKNYHNKK